MSRKRHVEAFVIREPSPEERAYYRRSARNYRNEHDGNPTYAGVDQCVDEDRMLGRYNPELERRDEDE